MNLERLVRPNIWNLKPYSSARNEFNGNGSVFLDANENPYNNPLNRYPDPLQWKVKDALARIKGVDKEQIFLGNGSDEPIDLVFRIFCEPGKNNVVAIDPTYGIYSVAAEINHVEYRPVPLNERFDFSAASLLRATDRNTRLIFLCSPNNPTGNSLNHEEIIETIDRFSGMVILDEAYIDFSAHPSMLSELKQHPNLIVFQTFSKAWGSAAARLGMAYAAPEVVRIMNKVKYPYNVNQLTQDYALELLKKTEQVKSWVQVLVEERKRLAARLAQIPCVKQVYPTDANFILVKVSDANSIYQGLVKKGIVVRNRNAVARCGNCLRITVGAPDENQTLLRALSEY